MRAEAVQILPEGAKARSVYLYVRDQITAGDLRDGEASPSEQKLAEAFGVSCVTVRRALDALVQGGLIERRAGSGTKVRACPAIGQRAAMNFNTLMPQLVEMGQKTTARLLSFSYGDAPDFVASAMGFEEETKVQIATRIRLAGDVPFSHLTTYVPTQITQNYSENDLATTLLFQLLERSGVKIKEAHQSVSATLTGPDIAEALDVEVGSALLSLRRVVCDIDGSGVEYLAGLYRPDMFRLEMPLTRVGQGSARHWEPAIDQDEGDA